jgi:elongation factor Ts
MIKTLREQTGAGMLECKKALEEAAGDAKRAVAILREKGAAKAIKRAERAMKQGRIQAVLSHDSRRAAMVEVNSETDFVARNEQFRAMHDVICATALETGCGSLQDLLAAKPVAAADQAATVQELVTNLIGVIGENMGVGRCVCFAVPDGAAGLVHSYIHSPDGQTTRVGVMVQLECENENAANAPATGELAHNLCLQVAFSNPVGIDKGSIPAETLSQEREIYRNAALKEGKPEKVVDKIVEGRLRNYYKENCLAEQPWIKDPEKTVAGLIVEAAKAAGGAIRVTQFARFQLGEESAEKA